MTLDGIAERLGVSKRTIMRWVKAKRFPKPTLRVGRIIEWNDKVVRDWCAKREGRHAHD